MVETYRRVLVVENKPVEVSTRQRGDELEVRVSGIRLSSRVREQIETALKRLLGLEVDLSEFYEFARSDKWLKPLAERFCGFKPPRFLSPFEALVNGITCQQLSLTVGISY